MGQADEKNRRFIWIGLGQGGYQSLKAQQALFQQRKIPYDIDPHFFYYPPTITESEKENISADSASPLISLGQFRTQLPGDWHEEWLDRLNLDQDELSRLPAEQNSQWARLLFAVNRDRIYDNILILFMRGQPKEVNIFILGDLSDPEVSGAVPDLALTIKAAQKHRGGTIGVFTHGVFRLPGKEANKRQLANTYAVLKELNHIQQAGNVEISRTSPGAGVSLIKEAPLEHIMLFPASPDTPSFERDNQSLFEWALRRFIRNTQEPQPVASFPDAENYSRPHARPSFGSFGAAKIDPGLLTGDDQQPFDMAELLCQAVPSLELDCPPSEEPGRLNWTIYANNTTWRQAPDLKETFHRGLVKIAEEKLLRTITTDADLPPALLSSVQRKSTKEISCLCEYMDLKLSWLKDLPRYRSAFQSLVAQGKFYQNDEEKAPDIAPAASIKSESLVVLIERSIRSGKIVISSSPPEKIKTDVLAAPFSGDLANPGVFGASILNSAGIEVRNQISDALAGSKECLDLEGDLLRVPGGDILAARILLVKLDTSGKEIILERISTLIQSIFDDVLPLKPASVTLPLLALEEPEPASAREIAKCMLEAVTALLSSTPQELEVIISVRQPEAVAEFVHSITEDLNNENKVLADKEHWFERNLPFPISDPYHHLTHSHHWDKEVSTDVDNLLQETLIFLASIAFSEYFSRFDLAQRGCLGDQLKKNHLIYEKMEYGNWVGIIREIGMLLNGEPDLFLSEGMNKIYQETLDRGSLINTIVERRNNWRHRNVPQGYYDDLISFIGQLDFLSEFKLIYVDGIKAKANERIIYSCFNLTGSDPVFERAFFECELQLGFKPYLVNESTNKVLDLYPLMQIKIRKQAKYNWVHLYTLQGFAGDLNAGKIIYHLRNQERCPWLPCDGRTKMEELYDRTAMLAFLRFLKGQDPEKQKSLRQKADCLHFLTPKEVRENNGD